MLPLGKWVGDEGFEYQAICKFAYSKPYYPLNCIFQLTLLNRDFRKNLPYCISFSCKICSHFYFNARGLSVEHRNDSSELKITDMQT